MSETKATEKPQIKYRLSTDKDRAVLHEFGQQVRPLGFPTVLAEEDGEIIGYMSTLQTENQVFAGPLYVKPGRNRGLLAVRLADVYGMILKAIGVTQYRFAVDTDNEGWVDVLKRTNAFEYEGIHSENHIFKRIL